MHRQSITPSTLNELITRSDFKGIPSASRLTYANQLVTDAHQLYIQSLPAYPLIKWTLKEKPHFAPVSKACELLLRKLSRNLLYAVLWNQPTRDSIVENLKHLLSEGVPYRIYRLDVKSFYESIDLNEARKIIENCETLSPGTKLIIDEILRYQHVLGECGVPRGLAVSATISELFLRNFDVEMTADKAVFFYARYVDDIIIITSSREDPVSYKTHIEKSLPQGLKLNEKKFSTQALGKSEKHAAGTSLLKLEYLGYEFSVENFVTGKPGFNRVVRCSISEKKINKIKTRIFRAFRDYEKNFNDELLIDRIRFLTSNFKVFNENTGHTNMAGVYFNYALIDQGDDKLAGLDNFLRGVIFAAGSVRRRGIAAPITNSLRRRLLKFSFERGHTDQVFTYFSGNKLQAIGRCWKY